MATSCAFPQSCAKRPGAALAKGGCVITARHNARASCTDAPRQCFQIGINEAGGAGPTARIEGDWRQLDAELAEADGEDGRERRGHLPELPPDVERG